jgi:pyruvate-ferredoxin/flavodoxin oxidoreductase
MVTIAREMASEADLQMRMQGIVLLGAFLKLTPYSKQSNMGEDEVYAGVEKALRKYFGKRGDRVVQDNLNCVKRGYKEMKEIAADVMLAGMLGVEEAKRVAATEKHGKTTAEVLKGLQAQEKK